MSWLFDPVFVAFSAWPSECRFFKLFGRDQKDARRKVMQIRGGITSGSAFIDRFMPL